MTRTNREPIRLFVSYSHRDERFREQLEEHLHALKRRGLIEAWHDRRIAPGQEWEGAINENLEAAGIVLLLVSSSFIASQYCYDTEMARALEKHESSEACIIPVILRPVDWGDAPFARLQALPTNGRPITRWSNRDEAWLDVARGIRQAVWAGRRLSRLQVKWLEGYARTELALDADDAAAIEREIMGDTKEAILGRQARAGEVERKNRLDELYDRARRSHGDREWQEVVDALAQIRAEDPSYPDPEGLLESAGDALEGHERARGAADLYEREPRHVEAEPTPARDHQGSFSTSRWEYVDFDLEIHEGREPGRYPVTAHSSGGDARAEMRFPFDERELKDRLRDLEVALLRSGGTRRRLDSTAEDRAVREFGRAMFEALLAEEVRAHYEASLREAGRQNKGLRLKLHIRPPELSTLPWEFLYDSERDYLCLSSMTPLVRYLDLPQPTERLTVTPPLRILGMTASPQGLSKLDAGHEKWLLEEAVKELRADGLVEVTWLEGETWRDLQRAMRRGEWHVFHFVGHGGFDPAAEEGAIALSDEGGRKDLLRATALARLLDDHYPLRLAFLNSCEGARGSETDAFSSTAATLVRCGIPAVVAMQYEITDAAAIEFSRVFYEALADGLPVDAAVAEARTAVSVKSALEWGTPVLCMRSSDGRIFDIQQSGDSERAPGRGRSRTSRRPDCLPGEREPKSGKPEGLPGW